MAEKIFNTRLLLKTDTLENWNKSSLKLKNGEVAIATVAASEGIGLEEPVCMIKVGTAEEKTFAELPWAFHANAADVLTACKSEKGLTDFVNGVINNAGIATNEALNTLAGKVTTAEGKITTLEGLVGSTKVADQITAAITALNLAGTYEAKGEAAKVQTALDTYKTANDKAVGENKTAIETEVARAKAAEKANTDAIAAIKDGTTIDSFADVETALAGKEASGAAAQALADAKAYANGLAGNYDASGSAAQALTDAKKYTDDEIKEWVGTKTVGAQISDTITGLKLADTYAAKEHKHTKSDITDFAHNHEISEVNGLQDALDDKVDKVNGKGLSTNDYTTDEKTKLAGIEAGANKTTVVNDFEVRATSETDALSAKQGQFLSAEISRLSDDLIDYEEAAMFKSVYDTDEDGIVDKSADANKLGGQLPSYYAKASDIPTKVSDLTNDSGYLTEHQDISGKADKATTLAGYGITDAYTTTQTDEKITDAINTFTSAYITSDGGAIDKLQEIANWIDSDKNGAADIIADVEANADAIEAINNGTTGILAQAKAYADAEDAKIESRVDVLETESAKHALASDLTTLAGRVDTAEDDIDALEEKVGNKAVSEQIADAIAEKNIKGVIYSTTAAPTASTEGEIGQIYVFENKGTSNGEAYICRGYRTVDGTPTYYWEKITVEDEVNAKFQNVEFDIESLEEAVGEWDGAGTLCDRVATLEEDKANSADLAAIATTGNVNDLVQTAGDVIIFDCGSSAV